MAPRHVVPFSVRVWPWNKHDVPRL
jgi:hypothetical protein